MPVESGNGCGDLVLLKGLDPCAMSGGFELQPQDGGPRLALAPGETVIGRGPLLGIHPNPCFYQSSEKSQFLPLRTNLWHWLNPGGSFSLLGDKYVFRVFSTYPETEMECTLRNSQMLDDDDILNETPKSSLNLPDESVGTLQQERNLEVAKTRTTNAKSASSKGECRNFSEQEPNSAQRKRILPAWMLTGKLSEKNLSAPTISGDNDEIQGSGKKAICKDKAQRNITQQGRKRLISVGKHVSESMSSEEDTEKKCRNADQEESSVISTKEMQSLSTIILSNSEKQMKTDTQRNKIPTDEFGQISEHTVSEGIPDEEDKAMNCSETSLNVQDETQGSHSESGSDPSGLETFHAKETDSDPQASEENKVKRTSCMYGASCYRKNPVHFQHFSHPGDSDYGNLQVANQDEADDRPECPYGASCYRKNPQHKIEYRHNALSMKSISDEDNNVGQPNEYDLNDSFLDDDEEEYEPTDEDSDWEPAKEDQEKEDVEELLKEAKKFMKRKK